MGLTPYQTAREAELVAQACRVLGALDMTHNALGHVSSRLDGGRMLIKGKGLDEHPLLATEPRDIVEIDFDARMLDGPDGLRAPSESFIHIAVYERHPEVQSVIHCHPEHAVVLSGCDLPLVPLYGQGRPGALLAIEGVPTYPFSHRITDRTMASNFVDTMGTSKVALMRGHGISVYGSGVEDATVRALEFNELLKMNYLAYAVGKPSPIPESDHEDLRPAERPLGSPGGAASVRAEWRYFARRAGEVAIERDFS